MTFRECGFLVGFCHVVKYVTTAAGFEITAVEGAIAVDADFREL